MKESVAIQKIRKILKDNLYRRRVLTRGGQVEFNRLGMHKNSKYLFTRPQEKKDKSYKVELLLDNSGSMYHCTIHPPFFGRCEDCTKYKGTVNSGCENRADPAFQACQSLLKVLGPVTDLNLTLFHYLESVVNWKEFRPEQHFFDNDVGYVEVKLSETEYRILKDTPENRKKGEVIDSGTGLAGNWEVANLLNAAKRLEKQEGQKIIVILLDGNIHMDYHHPPEYAEEGKKLYIAGQEISKYGEHNYKKLVESIESKGIKVLAYGINTSEPRHYYSNFTLIDNPEQIYEAIVKDLQKIIK